MNSKERMIRTIEGEEPDRVPLGTTGFYDWTSSFLAGALLPHFGLAEKWTPNGPPTWAADHVDKVEEMLGIDSKKIVATCPAEFRRKASYDPRFMGSGWGVRIAPDTLVDEFGITWQLVLPDKLHTRIISHPLKDPDALEDYVFPDPDAEGRYDEAEQYVERWHEEYPISACPADVYLFDQGWFLRGFHENMIDFYRNPSLIERMYDMNQKFFLGCAKRLAEMGITILAIPDDVAGQTGMILAPDLWRKHIKPRMKEVVDAMKRKDVYVLYHSDGDIGPIIKDLIEIGVDILNPIQPECMDPAQVKRTYGDRITLCGTISMQKTLPFGEVGDVRNEVIQRIKTCGQGGGLIIAPSNNAELDIPVDNFLAVYDTTKKHGTYPLSL